MRIPPEIALRMLNTKNAVILPQEVFFKEIKPRIPVMRNGIPQKMPSPIVEILPYLWGYKNMKKIWQNPTLQEIIPRTICKIDNAFTEFFLYFSFGCFLPLSIKITMPTSSFSSLGKPSEKNGCFMTVGKREGRQETHNTFIEKQYLIPTVYTFTIIFLHISSEHYYFASLFLMNLNFIQLILPDYLLRH